MSFGKPDATGRSSDKATARERKRRSPPKGEAWVWKTKELMRSPAHRAMSLTANRLLEFLLIEHMDHGGMKNGKLMATYDQLVDFGLSRRCIPEAIKELVFLGLIKTDRGYSMRGSEKSPNLYRLTFYPDLEGAPATQEWKGKTAEAIEVWKADQAETKRRRKRAQNAEGAVEDIIGRPTFRPGETAKSSRLRVV